MKIYVTSIGEPTTEICCWQLKRLGFEVILLDETEDWAEKYKKFVSMADDDCFRVDADVIVNENIWKMLDCNEDNKWLMIQSYGYDFYRNNIRVTSPIFYSKKALEIIRKNIDKIDKNRPETSAWRFSEINPLTKTCDFIVGMHGFFQGRKEFKRALKNKEERKQIEEFDFELADRLLNL